MRTTEYLDDDFNRYAKDLADLQKGINMIKKKLVEFQKEVKVNVNRLTMYIVNQFFKEYKFTKDVILFRRDNKVEFQKTENVDLAKKKYEELKESTDDSWLLDELDLISSENILITIGGEKSDDDSELEYFYQNYDNIKKYLPKTNRVFEINAKQKMQLKELLLNCDNPKYQFLLEKLDAFQNDYLEIVDEVLDNLANSEYEFDIERDEIVTIRDDKDMTWHLAIERNEEGN